MPHNISTPDTSPKGPCVAAAAQEPARSILIYSGAKAVASLLGLTQGCARDTHSSSDNPAQLSYYLRW